MVTPMELRSFMLRTELWAQIGLVSAQLYFTGRALSALQEATSAGEASYNRTQDRVAQQITPFLSPRGRTSSTGAPTTSVRIRRRRRLGGG